MYIRSERIRQFQPPYYTVFVYRCDACDREYHLRANSFRGKTPERSIGAMLCDCGAQINF